MEPPPVLHDHRLLQFSGTSLRCRLGEIDTPIEIVVSSQAGPASGIRQKCATATCASEGHIKTSPRNTLSPFALSLSDTVAINLTLAAEGARLASDIQSDIQRRGVIPASIRQQFPIGDPQ